MTVGAPCRLQAQRQTSVLLACHKKVVLGSPRSISKIVPVMSLQDGRSLAKLFKSRGARKPKKPSSATRGQVTALPHGHLQSSIWSVMP